MTNQFPFPFKSVVLTLAAHYSHFSFTKSCLTSLRTIPLSPWWAYFLISSVDPDVKPGLRTTTSSQSLHGMSLLGWSAATACLICGIWISSKATVRLGLVFTVTTVHEIVGHKSHFNHQKMEVILNGSICRQSGDRYERRK